MHKLLQGMGKVELVGAGIQSQGALLFGMVRFVKKYYIYIFFLQPSFVGPNCLRTAEYRIEIVKAEIRLQIHHPVILTRPGISFIFFPP